MYPQFPTTQFPFFARAGDVHSRPEPLYYWFYFMFMNALWIVIPGLVAAYAFRKITAAFGGGKAPRAAAAPRSTPSKKRK